MDASRALRAAAMPQSPAREWPEEGEEVISESKEKGDVSCDLAIIGAAQKVEHYEMAVI